MVRHILIITVIIMNCLYVCTVKRSTCDSNVMQKMKIIGPLILNHLKKYISYNLVNNLILNYYQRSPIIILVTEKMLLSNYYYF